MMEAHNRSHCLTMIDETNYWSFDGRAERKFSHGFLQYPAMMVPGMQGEIIDMVRQILPEMRHIWDPFVGSGTTLGEAMLRGLDFTGNDINPLAILVAKTKTGPFYRNAAIQKTQDLYNRIDADLSDRLDIDFYGRDKWFTLRTSNALCRMRHAIQLEKSKWARRFFWVALAECVRLTSNSRTSTYKLHLRSKAQLDKERDNPTNVFKKILNRNLKNLISFQEQLLISGYLRNGRYKGAIEIALKDTTVLPGKFLQPGGVDLVITSPPYGDNRTTVPYGQYSYLPLNWIDSKDIDDNFDISLLESTNALDTRSLGGSYKNYDEKQEVLSQKYKIFSHLHDSLASKSHDAKKKVTSFIYDLDSCITPITNRLQPGGVMVWTLGNRTVSSTKIPLTDIFEEMIRARGMATIKKFDRVIPSKRMPSKNNISETMKSETIIVARKPSK